MDDRPGAATASYAVLHTGYGDANVASTVGFVRDGDVVVVTHVWNEATSVNDQIHRVVPVTGFVGRDDLRG
jgi:hypothetical protein